MAIKDIIERKKSLFGTTLTLRSPLLTASALCWMCHMPKAIADDFYANSIVLKIPGLISILLGTTGSNVRVGGPKSPACFDDVRVTGVLDESPFDEFDAMLKDISEVTVFGVQGREIAIDLATVNSPASNLASDHLLQLELDRCACPPTVQKKKRRRISDRPAEYRKSYLDRLNSTESRE